MTTSFDSRLWDIVIPNSATATRAVNGNYEYSDATCINIQAPAALDAGTYVIQTRNDGVNWVNLNDGTNDILAPAAGKSRQYTEMIGAKEWRISGPTSTADREFFVNKQWTV